MSPPQTQLPPGHRFQQWTISQRLGGGAFGEVYRVRGNGAESYALKTERVDGPSNVLMMDVTVLREATQRRFRHFCLLVDCGKHGDYYFVVMTLVGPSLHDLRKSRPTEHFTMGTAIGLAIQTLEAIEELHTLGYLHRDIKPGNYSIGLTERGEQRRVFMLDFGMCRKYVKEDGTQRRARQVASFRGTPRYAPLRCHLRQDYCRADDVESWIYMIVEMTTAGIPWKKAGSLGSIGAWKERVHRLEAELLRQLFNGCPPAYEQILRHVITLTHVDAPTYSVYKEKLRQAMITTKSTEFPYDWER